MVSGRAVAALVAQLLLAQGRRADLDRRALIADEERRYPDAASECTAAALPRSRRRSGSARSTYSRPTRMRSITHGASASSRPMSIRPAPSSRTRSSARAWRASSRASSMRPSATCCRSPRPAEGAPWQSGRWFLRSERCYLIPGDSPMGYRLPLDSLPWVEPADFPHIYPPDPNQTSRRSRSTGTCAERWRPRQADRAPRRRGQVRAAIGCAAAGQPGNAGRGTSAPRCAPQERNGVLHVFMPPTRCLEDYLEIVAAVESSAKSLAATGDHRGLRAAAGSAPGQFQGHAGSGRDRGQRAAERELGRARRAHHASVRDCAQPASCARKNS